MSRRVRYGALAAFVCLVVIGRALLAAASVPIGTVHLTAGWATFGQAVPKGFAFDGLQVGSLVTQTDIKNRWPDGSIKFAVITANVGTEGDYEITAAAPASGALIAAPANISVNLTLGSDNHIAALPTTPGDPWLDGPLVSERRHVVAPIGSGGLAHQSLRVIFDTRTYADGATRADITVENVLNVLAATTVTYDVAIAVNGAQSFARENVEHFYLTRWRHTVTTGSFSSVTPDIASLHSTKAVPPYLPLVTEAHNEITGPGFDILQEGALDNNMPAHGGRAELAPYPDWAARYLVHPNAQQKDFVLKHGDLSGSWPVHVREPESGGVVSPAPSCLPGHASPLGVARPRGVGDERFVSLAERPDLWLDHRARCEVVNDPANPRRMDYIQGSPLPIQEYGDLEPGPGQSPLIPDNAHQPSLAYIPYLLTGDRYYAEEMAMWANYGMMRTFQGNNLRGANGLLGDQETRGMAWALRNLADAAAYYPDASPVKQYLSDRVLANLQSLDALIASLDPVTNPLKLFRVDYRNDIIADPSGLNNVGFIALWEHNYLAYAIDRANHQGFDGGRLARDAVAELQLKLFTSNEYPRQTVLAEDFKDPFSGDVILPQGSTLDWGAPYLIAVARVNDGFTWAGGFELFTSMQQIGDATTSPGHPVTGPFYLDRWRPYAGYYGPEARLNLMIGINNYNASSDPRWGRAQEAYDHLFPFIGVRPDGCDSTPDLVCRAGWALDAYPPTPVPPSGNVDGDGDGVFDSADNCPAIPNADQANFDGDTHGDACDLDDDNDGASDFDETAAGSDPRNSGSKPEICDGLDNDLDGVSDDGLPNNDGDAYANPCDPDDDNDGVEDLEDDFPFDGAETVDTDGDGTGNNADLDDDGDNVVDTNDRFPLDATESKDNDNDGQGDNADGDDDNDGVADTTDAFPLDKTETVDTDGDGTGNNADTDDDGDGALDTVDTFPLDKNETVDTDGDGTGNNADPDDDGDTVSDADDRFPLDATESKDNDNDGQGDNADTDDDNDGVVDTADAFPLNAAETVDTDGDGAGNNADTDDDGDGALDTADAFPLNAAESIDTDGDGTGNNADPDDDGDTVSDADDRFPLDSTESKDNDNDGQGDNVDTDDDNDGVIDASDRFPFDRTESTDNDNDGQGDNADTDDDNDGVVDTADAFPLNAAESKDFDGDGIGDNADPDDDNDDTPDTQDAFPLNAAETVDTDGDGTGNNADTDDDGDGALDTADTFPLDKNETVDTDGDGTGNNADTDDDGDGALDTADTFPLDKNETVDTDGDGTGNNADPDDDGDGALDTADTFPLDKNETVDTDGDGTGNNADPDDDGDTVSDADDRFPLDSTESKDNDNDGQGDNADGDDDNDGVTDTADAFPLNGSESVDTDGDGTGNNADTDDDGDGALDGADAFPLDKNETVDTDGDGTGNNADLDDDNDKVSDADDRFPLDAAESKDNDNDGQGDNADGDDDNDGVADTADAFPLNAAESVDTDGDGTGNNADPDDDGDGALDGADAFPLDKNETVDTDGDGTGNNADTDDDGDGALDTADAFPLNASESVDTDGDGTGNNADTDDDGDGVADSADAFPLNATESIDTDGDGTGNNADTDDDGDGAPDTADAFPLDAAESIDTDGDGTGNNADTDDDGDGAPDTADAFPLDAAESIDTDGDGTGNNADTDDDGDGVADAEDAFPLNAAESIDTDGDGTGNNADTDDDNDGVADTADAFPLNAAETVDTDGDGIGNNADPDDDGDNVLDTDDRFPLDGNESTDNDNDGTGDNADTDDDNDGRSDDVDPLPLVANRAPTVESPGAQAITIGVAIAPLPIVAADPDGDMLMWSAEGLPAGLSLSPSGVITGSATAVGTSTVTISVSDGLLGAATTFEWVVNNTPVGTGVVVDTPDVDITFSNITSPGTTTVTPTPSVPGEVPAGFSIAGLPAFDVTTTASFTDSVALCFDVSALELTAEQFNLLRVLHGENGMLVDRTILAPDSPAPDFAAATICARVTSLSPFAIATRVNQPPAVETPAPPQATVGVEIGPLTIIATDLDGDALTYAASGLPPGLVLNGNVISGTPTAAGSFDVSVTVSDDRGKSTTASFTWVVRPPDAVSLDLVNPGPQTNSEGDKVRLKLEWASTALAGTRSTRPMFTAAGLPPGLHIREHDGIISGQVSRRGEGTYNVIVTLRVNDEEVSETFVWTILPRNQTPRVTKIDDQDSTVGRLFRLFVRAVDGDGDELTFDVQGLPAGVKFDAATGVIEGIPSESRDSFDVTVSVSDGRASDSQSFEWRVRRARR